ncbi:phage tail sheath family protein [Acidaminococcus sp.]|uniref:phage tail sheath family protein n=1 Tax=Acidaminococcus sp. TaxID=1872103 RepID=UPI003D7C78B0
MSYGGGTFLTQNKVLPGTYINFISVAKASSELSDRGYGALAMNLDWGPDSQIFMVEQEDFQTDAQKYFGYDYTDDAMKGLRDLFLNLKTLYCYKLNSGGAKALCDYCEAKYSGTRGNQIMVAISANVDDTAKFDVSTYFDGVLKDQQTGVKTLAELQDNDFVTWTDSANIAVTAGTYLTGGTNGTAATGTTHSDFLSKLESYSFNTLGCLSTDKTIQALYLAWTKRMRDDIGAKFQTIGYNTPGNYEGWINCTTSVKDSTFPESSLIYWLVGAEASCQVNRTVGNKQYDGEFTPIVKTKQTDLKNQIKNGELCFHQVNGAEFYVLKDINSLTSFSKAKTRDFSLNQVMRVLDQWANDIAVLFAKYYLDKEQNLATGRTAFWNDIVDYASKMEGIGAIDTFDKDALTVEKGEEKESVLVNSTINPAVAMEKVYMYTYVA